jgi:hypothetical protein
MTLFETKLISHKKVDGSELTQKDLAHFVSKNFGSKSRDNISLEGFENNMGPSKRTTLPSIDKELKLIRENASH